ncbi:hypothetical protein ACIA8M_38035 [Streptomyces anulatus]
MPEQETSSTVAQAADDGRRLVLRSLTLEIEGGTPTTWQLDAPQALAELKEKGFTLTEGSHYKLRYAFQVRHDIISGLTYVSATSRQRIKVDKDRVLLGSLGPQAAPHEGTIPRSGWAEAPTGAASRGAYTVKATFVDDEGAELAKAEYAFTIASA